MIEVLVSALLVALIAAAVAQALIAGARFTSVQRGRSQADEIAQQDQERMRGLSAEQLNGLNQVRIVTLDSIPFTVDSTAQFLNSSGTSSCSGSGTAASYFSIVSTVMWSGNGVSSTSGTRPSVVERSIITPPAGGTLLTQVQDQTGSPLSGVTVAASGPDVASGVTDSTGCTVLAGLVSGSYTVSLTDPGYVDPSGNASPLSKSATVTSTGTATPGGGNPIVMGLAGTIATNFTARISTTTLLSGQQTDAMSWLGTGASSGMSNSSTYGPVALAAALPTTGTIALFPFAFAGPSYTNNYQVWAGPCRQMQPPTGQDMATVGPGSNQTVSVQEPALNVIVKYAGVQVKPAHLKITFNSTTGPACSDTWTPSVAANAGTSPNNALAFPGQPFATSATTGTTASASGYTSTLSVCADYVPSGLTSRTANVSTVNNNLSTPTTATILLTSTSPGGVC